MLAMALGPILGTAVAHADGPTINQPCPVGTTSYGVMPNGTVLLCQPSQPGSSNYVWLPDWWYEPQCPKGFAAPGQCRN
jgi:hypothetical protein